MDLSKLTTDQLLAGLPRDAKDPENDRWECKGADLLDDANRGLFKGHLAKQVSAFANSGGGYIVFGISNDRSVTACRAHIGRQTTKDWLATMIEQSVEYPIRQFRVHRVPISGGTADDAVFVAEIEDSQAAPHQSKEDRHYYYRIDGHSKPAPHFHIELLRNRVTRTVLEIKDVTTEFGDFRPHQFEFIVHLSVQVENVSWQASTAWGIYLLQRYHEYEWKRVSVADRLDDGICVQSPNPVVLPGERRTLVIDLIGSGRSSQHVPASPRGFERMWEAFHVTCTPLSNNHRGAPFTIGWRDRVEWFPERDRLLRAMQPYFDE